MGSNAGGVLADFAVHLPAMTGQLRSHLRAQNSLRLLELLRPNNQEYIGCASPKGYVVRWLAPVFFLCCCLALLTASCVSAVRKGRKPGRGWQTVYTKSVVCTVAYAEQRMQVLRCTGGCVCGWVPAVCAAYRSCVCSVCQGLHGKLVQDLWMCTNLSSVSLQSVRIVYE